jgi:hypothetical protein
MKYAFEISDVRGDYLRDCDFRRFADPPLRLRPKRTVSFLNAYRRV